jgi:hypothetical protein
MQNMDNVQQVISWTSTKNADGTFTAKVRSSDFGISVQHASFDAPTRAGAVTKAKKCVLYIKALNPTCLGIFSVEKRNALYNITE